MMDKIPERSTLQEMGKLILALSVAILFVAAIEKVHYSGFLKAAWGSKTVKKIEHVGGYCYGIRLSANNINSRVGLRNTLILEDGRPLGPARASHAEVQHGGVGQFYGGYNYVYFSSSDNTPADSNGRTYVLRYPHEIPLGGKLAYALACFLLVYYSGTILLKARRSKALIWAYDRHEPLLLWAGVALVIGSFIIARASFYTYSQLTSIQPDYGGYNAIALSILNGDLPDLSYRTVGYPLFMAAVNTFSNTFGAIVSVQFAVSLAATLLLLIAVYRLLPLAAFPVAICLAAFQASGAKTIMDAAILSDSLYTSVLMVIFALLLFYMRRQRTGLLWGASALAGCLILIRPTGLVIFPAFLILFAYLFFKQQARLRVLLAIFLLPVLTCLAMKSYNLYKIDKFTMTNGGSMTWSITTSGFLEEDPSYPPEWNAAIREIQEYLTPEAREIVLNSWDYYPFYSAYSRGFWCSKIWNPLQKACSQAWQDKDINKIVAMDAIRKHPDVYAKIVLLNIYTLIYRHTDQDINYNQHLKDIYRLLIQEKIFKANPMEEYYKEFHNVDTLSGFKVDANGKAMLEPSWTGYMQERQSQLFNMFFRKAYWGSILIGTILISFILLVKKRFNSPVLFTVLLLGLTTAGHNVMIALFTFGELRLSIATLFANYLAAAILATYVLVSYWPQLLNRIKVLCSPTTSSSDGT